MNRIKNLVLFIIIWLAAIEFLFCQKNNTFHGNWFGSRQIQAFNQCFDGMGNFLCGGNVTFPLTSDIIIAKNDTKMFFGDNADGHIRLQTGPTLRFRFMLGTGGSHPATAKARIKITADDGAAYIMHDFYGDAYGPDYLAHVFGIGFGFWEMDGDDGATTMHLSVPHNLYDATGTGNFVSTIQFNKPKNGSGSPPNVDTSIFDIENGYDVLFNLMGHAIGTHAITVSSNPIFNPVVGAFKMADDEVFSTIYHTPIFASSGGTVPSSNTVIKYDGSKLTGGMLNDNGTRIAINPGAIELFCTVFASLPSDPDGTQRWCCDCDPNSIPCTSIGTQTGNFAFRENGAWNCK